MKHTPAPQKSRELFFSSTQGCTFKKNQVLTKKQFTLQQSLSLFQVKWSKTIKFNYFECCFKWYFHNFGLMVRLICFANIFVHTIVSFQYIYGKCLGCNRTKKLLVVNCSVSRDIDLMQIIQYCLESAGTPYNTKQLFVVLNL